MSKSPARQRKDELALIHIGKEELGWDEDTYRDALEAWTGKRSSSEMSEAERHEVIENMKKMGFTPTSDREERLEVAEGDKPHVQKIKGLWLLLHDEGAVKNPSLDSLNAFVQRMTDVDHVRWLPPAEAPTVIEALKGWYERETTE
jgi:phage gp16-like protein